MGDTVKQSGVLEIVLHNAGNPSIVEAFVEYARHHGGRPLADRRRDLKGLTFIPVQADFARAEEIARFSFVRVARPMPTLRPLSPDVLRAVNSAPVQLPSGPPLDSSSPVAIFDGGLPDRAVEELKPWVKYIEAPGIGPAVREYQDHGLAVTTAFLFGPLSSKGKIPQPVCGVDHVRVIDQTAGNSDLECLDVLDRIISFLDSNEGHYQFVNLSLGPRMAIRDDEVTQWTAALDQRLAGGSVVATVAAGNDGTLPAHAGLNRLQPPADGVNVLGVGAIDASDSSWSRADIAV